MEIEKALDIVAITIKELSQIKPRGTGIRAENVKGLVVKNCRFSGLEKALDVSNSQDITWEKNIVNNYPKYSELPYLLEQFLTEAKKPDSKINKSVLVRLKDQVLQRWPEISGTFLAVAMMRIIEYFR